MIDLHVHTTSSDGTLAPQEVVNLARRLRLRAVAITDHDTVAGVAAAQQEGSLAGVEVIAGVELSAQNDFGILHILGYFISTDHLELLNALERLKKGREERTVKILSRLQEQHVDLPLDEVKQESGGGVPGRPHIANVMKRRRIVSSLQEAFDRYLRKGASAYVPKLKLPPAEALRLIRISEGIPVLAHPHSLLERGPSTLERLIVDLTAHGLRGIEVYYPKHTKTQTKLFRRLAEKHNLAVTGGTDFHGANKPHIELGVIAGRPPLPYSVLEDLKKMWEAISSTENATAGQGHGIAGSSSGGY